MAFSNAPAGSGRNDDATGYDSAASALSVNSGGGTGGSRQNRMMDPQADRWSDLGRRTWNNMASDPLARAMYFELAGAAGTPEHIALQMSGPQPAA